MIVEARLSIKDLVGLYTLTAGANRRTKMNRLILLIVICLLCGSNLFGQGRPNADTPRSQTITEKISGMQKFPGLFPFYWDAKAGKLWLEIDKWNSEFLYVESLLAGIGSNDIGLDRGQVG